MTVRRSYKQKVLETHPDKLSPTASEEEKSLAQELFRQVGLYPIPFPGDTLSHQLSDQVQDAFEILNDPVERRVRPSPAHHPAHTSIDHLTGI